jgi:hypothetical protein
MMNILLVSSAFYPEISPRSFRATELAKEFARQGESVTVCTRDRNFNYEAFLKDYPIELKTWSKRKYPVVPELNTQPFSIISRFLRRFLGMFFEYPDIEELFKVRRKLRSEFGYDLMISFAVPYPVHWGVSFARKKHHHIAKTWVADCGDPYMGDVLDSFRKLFYFKYLEKRFCRRCDYLSIPVESARKAYYPEFHEKIRVIPQGFDFDLNRNRSAPENNTVKFAYAGTFLQGIRDPRPMLGYLSTQDLDFEFYLFTNRPEFLEDFRDKLDGKLIVSQYIPRDELMSKLEGMDFLVNFDNNTELNIPSKLIDYIILNRPVLNITNDFDSSIVKEFLGRNYQRKMDLPEYEKFHIRNVSGEFRKLAVE